VSTTVVRRATAADLAGVRAFHARWGHGGDPQREDALFVAEAGARPRERSRS